jgi:acyl-CoA synthetase (AMP-forming)/AMP-acid ligase II
MLFDPGARLETPTGPCSSKQSPRRPEEVPKAFVVKHADASPTAEELIDFVAERVASYEKIRRVEFIDSVPRSANGKILRRRLTQASDN